MTRESIRVYTTALHATMNLSSETFRTLVKIKIIQSTSAMIFMLCLLRSRRFRTLFLCIDRLGLLVLLCSPSREVKVYSRYSSCSTVTMVL